MDNRNDFLDNLEIPESLQPEHIEQMLNEHKKEKKNTWTIQKTIACCASVGLITLAGVAGAIALQSNYDTRIDRPSGLAARTEDKNGILHLVSSKKELENYFKYNHLNYGGDIVEEEMAPDATAPDASDSDYSFNDDDTDTSHSSTNVMVDGIDEGDIVKTDGKYLYVLRSNGILEICSAKEGKLEKISSINATEEDHGSYYAEVREFYLDEANHKLIVMFSAGQTYIQVFDITNPSKPDKAYVYTQSGEYYTSRYVGEYIYVFSRMWASELEGCSGIPSINGANMDCSQIYMSDGLVNSEMIMSAVKVNSDGRLEVSDSTSVIIPYNEVYMGHDNIYLYYMDYEDWKTCIIRFGYSNGKFDLTGTTRVNGYIQDKFAISERDGYLFLLTKESSNMSSENRFDVYDEEFKVVGSVRDIAPDELIYAARYIGDKVYFITYRQIDPLFVVDISDPTNPTILGEVEITGYSEYLHPYGDNLLLGLGYETVDNGYGGMRQDSLKLVMFDISDAMNPAIKDAVEIPNSYYSEALYDYKAIFVSKEKNLIGLMAYVEDGYEYGARYFLYQWKDDHFELAADYAIENCNDLRGNFIGDYFYLTSSNGIISVDILDGFEKVDEVKF